MDAVSAVAQPDDGLAPSRATASAPAPRDGRRLPGVGAEEALAISAASHPSIRVDQLADASTVEFAPGFTKQVSFGTPPPPSRAELYAARLERSGRSRGMVRAVGAIVVLVVLAVGLVYLGHQPPARPLAISASPSPATSVGGATVGGTRVQGLNSSGPTAAGSPNLAPNQEPTGQEPRTPARDPLVPESSALPTGPVLTGPTSVPFGQSLLLDVTDLPCGAGAHVDVTLRQSGPEALVANGATATNAAGKASIHVYVVNVNGTPGQVERLTDPPGYLTLSPGSWTVRAANRGAPECSAAASATTTITVIPAA